VSIGRPATKTDLDSAAGAIAISLFATMDNIAKFKATLDTLTTTDLQGLGYTSTEASQIKSAFTDLDKIRTVFIGTATQSTTYDFRTFAKLLLGTGLY
jgi:homoaconitase/3-isopropylmalate dehydratase large subunit